jgi:hypothetical protein
VFVVVLFIRLKGEPRHVVEAGETASDEGKMGTPLCCRPARRRDEDELVLLFCCRRGTWASVGLRLLDWAWLLVGCVGGLGRTGKVQVSFFLFILFSVFFLIFLF